MKCLLLLLVSLAPLALGACPTPGYEEANGSCYWVSHKSRFNKHAPTCAPAITVDGSDFKEVSAIIDQFDKGIWTNAKPVGSQYLFGGEGGQVVSNNGVELAIIPGNDCVVFTAKKIYVARRCWKYSRTACREEVIGPAAKTKLLVAGGDEFYKPTEVLNFAEDGKFCIMLPTLVRDGMLISTGDLAMPDGSPVACGGFLNEKAETDKCFKFDKASKYWDEMSVTLPRAEEQLDGVEFSENKFLLAGKGPLYVFENGVMSPGPALPEQEDGFPFVTMAKLADNVVFVPSTHHRHAYVYNMADGSHVWHENLLEHGCSGCTVGVALNSAGEQLIVISGGYAGFGNKVQVVKYPSMESHVADEAAAAWFTLAQTVQYGDTFLVLGGGPMSSPDRRVFEFDADGEKYVQKTELTIPRTDFLARWVDDDFVTCFKI